VTVLITGGMGFTGLHTAKSFLDAGEDVVITWYQTWREPSFIKEEYNKRVKIERVDVTSHHDMVDAVRKHDVTDICHLAVPGLAALSPAEDFRVNMAGLINVLEAGRLSGVRRISVASSQTVYGGVPEGPFREDMNLPAESRSGTEAFKKSWEILAMHWGERTGVEVINLRLGGIVGPLYHTLANLMSRLVHAAVKGTEPNYGQGARGGVPFAEDTQDWGYVKNIALGIQLLHTTEKLNHQIYNVGGGRAATNQEIVDAIHKVIPDAKLPMNEGRSPRWRPNGHMDLTRLKEDTGYKPEYEIPEAIADYIQWLRAGNAL
jgi:UDP-glucose 4-epimerase